MLPMENPTRIKERLDNYYKALSEKGDFGPLLSENFLLTGTVAKETKGREAYTNNMFFKMVKSLEKPLKTTRNKIDSLTRPI